MKTLYRVVFFVSLVLMTAALMGMVFSRYWINTPQQRESVVDSAQSKLVDERPLLTAEQLARLAATPEEQDLAQQALRVADHEVDMNFASALRNATLHPAPLSQAARAISARIQDLQGQIKAQQEDINRIKLQLAKVKEDQKQSLDEELQLQEALLEVAQEELDGAQQELIRSGGDQKSIIQRLQEQHESGHQRQNAIVGSAFQNSQQAPEQTESRSLLAQGRAWLQLNAKAQQLARAQQELKAGEAELSRQREQLEKNAQGGDGSPSEKDQGTSGPAQAGNRAAGDSGSLFPTLKLVAAQQRDLAEIDKRNQDLQSLEAFYGSWTALVKTRQREFAIGIAEALVWIFAVSMVVLLANPLLGFVFSRVEVASRRLHTLRVAFRFALQMTGLGLILLVIFGPPSQLATVIALAGAGLTVALKDFIVGFIGWFALMGANGIRAGDWVEIDGVGGEVLEVGPLHTILLETGGWSDAGHPTGRKVTFVNSFAIEGHYFNFSTAGQWLWDEIQVPLPAGIDPQPVVEAIQKIVTKQTEANARVAEQEWHRVVVPSRGNRPFSAAPTVSVQPTGPGVTVIARYITRAPEWREQRARLYGDIVELLRKEQIPSSPADVAAPKSMLAAAEPH